MPDSDAYGGNDALAWLLLNVDAATDTVDSIV
jgi:hypothetical protein